MAKVTQFEAERIGERTREAITVAAASGVRRGGRREVAAKAAQSLRGLIAPLVESGQSRDPIAAALHDAGHWTEGGST